MLRAMKRICVAAGASILLGLLLTPEPALSAEPSATAAPTLETVRQVVDCIKENLPHRSSVQTLAFVSTDRVGSVSRSVSTLHWERGDNDLSRALLRFLEPVDLKGSGLLMLEQKERGPETFMYLPELRKVRRVSSRAASSSLFGTDFSYEDFERLLGMSVDMRKEKMPDASWKDRAVYVIATYPDPESDSAYERVVNRVAKETCTLLEAEFYEPGNLLRKRLTIDLDQITREGDRWIPRRQTMEDLRDETKTDLLIEEIELDVKIHRKMFSQRNLESGAR